MKTSYASNDSNIPTTRLRGRKLLLGRALWLLLTVGAICIFITDIPARFDLIRGYALAHLVGLGQIGLSATSFAFYFIAFSIATMVLYSCVALIIFWRRSDDWMAIFMSGGLVVYGAFGTFLLFSQGMFQSPDNILVTLMQAFVLGWVINFYYLFPSGRFIPRWTRVLTLVYAAWASIGLFYAPANMHIWPLWLSFAVIGTLTGIGVFAQFQRYHLSNALERQQTKWVVFGLTFVMVGFVGFHLSRLLSPAGFSQTLIDVVGVPFVVFCELVVLVSTAIAVLRYRLWDTDPLINLVLVYGTLTGILAAIYFGLVIALQFLLHGLINQVNDLVIVGSTLVIAFLVQPVRRRVQIIIDRRFYRRKYDIAKVVAAFSDMLRQETDLDLLHAQLLSVVQETMQPSHVSLWVPLPNRTKTVTGTDWTAQSVSRQRTSFTLSRRSISD